MSTEQYYDTTTGQPLMSRFPGAFWGELASGDEMTQEEFHSIYEQSPEDFKAELIGGAVFVASPVRDIHAQSHALLSAVLVGYVGGTSGVMVSDNATVHLGPDTEVQPDLLLRISPECGGQTTTNRQGYVQGAPEFVIEIAVSSRGVDLNAKRRQYARYGVREYVVACVKEQQLRWFDLAAGQELLPDANGVCRVQTFPGLWIDGKALFAQDYAGLMQTLNEGLATPEHGAFVRELESWRGK